MTDPGVSAEPPVREPGVGEASLRRELGVGLGVLVVINSTIGTGIFKTPAAVARLSGSAAAALGVWVAGAVIALCGALCLAELSAALPRTGGLYEYLRRAYGPRVAFLMGWTKLLLLIPSATGGFSRLAAEALAATLGLPSSPTRDTAVAITVLVACALANVSGVRASATGQALVSGVKYLGVALLALIGLTLSTRGVLGPAPADVPAFATSVTVGGAFAALVSVMWAYDGWADLSSLSGEVREPGRTLPRALCVGTLAVAVGYLAANVGYLRVLGLDGLRRSTTGANLAAANVAWLTLGDVGRTLLSALVFVSSVGGCMASLLTGSRMLVPMASDGVFVRALGVVSPRSHVPVRAVLVGAALGAVYVASRSFEQLTDGFVVGYFPFYALAVIAVFVLRRREPRLARPFRVPGYPLVPLVFLAGAAALIAGALIDVGGTAAWSFGVLLAGIPAGELWRRRAQRARIGVG